MTEYRNRIKEYRTVASAELVRNPANFRRHPEHQRAALRGLLTSVGRVAPLLAWENDGQLLLIDGHARLDESPEWDVAILDIDADEAATVLAMLDKIGADAEIDPEALMTLLDALPAEARQTAQAAWSDEELAAIIGEAAGEQEPEPDEPVTVDETTPTRCQPGDVWRVGRHTVACLDSTEPGTLNRLLEADPDMVWSDAPYGINAVENSPRMQELGYTQIANDATTETARAVVALLVTEYEAAVQIWWGGNYFADALPPARGWIVWDKDHHGMDFADAELAWCNADRPVRCFRHAWSGADRDSEKGEHRTHPNQKPIALCAWAFEKYGSAGDLIFDPFLGSGPSLKAAEASDRTVIGCELSPAYCDHIIAWGEAHGLPCERVSDAHD